MRSLGYLLDTNRDSAAGALAPAAASAALHSLVELGVAAEALGFDAVFVPERHMRAETVAPGGTVLLAALAARTATVRLGTCATVVSLHNPMLLAESLAQIDLLSGGRLTFSATLGYHADYWRFAGVADDARVRRFSEAMDVLLRAWGTDEPWSHEGECFSLRDVRLLPLPFQRPRPVVWAGGGADEAVRRGARWGDAWVADPFPFDDEAWRRKCALFRDEAAGHGHPDPQVALIRQVIVAPTRAEAEARCAERYLPLLRFYFDQGVLTNHPDFTSAADITVERARRHVVMGTPADCAEAIERFTDSGADHLVLKFAGQRGTDPAAEREELELFGAEVLPRLARAAA